MCKAYTDSVTDSENILLDVSMPGGLQNVNIELVDDGQAALIKYSWPKPMYDIVDLFQAQLDREELTIHHPMILCFKTGLQETRKRIDSAPTAFFKVTLPINVQVVPGNFTGLAKDYVVTETDEIVNFGR